MSEQAKTRKNPFSYLFYDFVKLTSALPGFIVFRPKRIYENEAAKEKIRGGALIISNHIGFFDPIYLMFAVWYRRHHFICRAEFFKSKARLLFKGFHCIPIDRENFSMDSFRTITAHLTGGKLVSMFPEGHISGEQAAFKSGMVLMAVKGGAPIVPVYIKKREHFYNRLTVVIGAPVDAAAFCGARPAFAKIGELTAYLQTKEDELKKLVSF